MSIDFCGIALAHPVINGSGTFDAIAARTAFGDAIDDAFPFAAFVSKTITLAPRAGNPPPRLWEAQAGLVNSIGLPNKGVARYLAEDLPELARLPVPLITNVMGSTAEEIAELARACDERAEIAAIELNVSCPNVRTGLDIGADPIPAGARPRRGATRHKQADDRQAHTELRRRGGVRQSGAGGRRGRRLADQHAPRMRARPKAASAAGARPAQTRAPEPVARRRHRRALGAAIRPVALAQVAAVAARVSIPVVGHGGHTERRPCPPVSRRGRDARGGRHGELPRPYSPPRESHVELCPAERCGIDKKFARLYAS